MNNDFLITEAQREQLIGSIALIGPSGSGKTLSSLKIAKGMIEKKYPDMPEKERWKKVGFIDTEHKRSKIYANTSRHGIGAFIHLDFQKPYTLDRLDDAVIALKQHGCEILIIDSLTHFWEGDGGILDLQQSFGGTFAAWRDTNPHYTNFISIVTGERHDIDTISCIRAKQAYEVSTSETGKLKVEKLGLKPVQRDSLEFEFHIVFNVDMDHVASAAAKDNSELFGARPMTIEPEVGEKIYDWLKLGVDALEEERKQKEAQEKAEKEERDAILKTYEAYRQDDMTGLGTYAIEMEKKAKANYGSLEEMPLQRLRDMMLHVSATAKNFTDEREALIELAKDLKIKNTTKKGTATLRKEIDEAKAKK